MTSAFVPPRQDIPLPLSSADITRLFPGKPAGWFDRDRVRKRLYSKGFPRPFERGLWSSEAVRMWLVNVGTNATYTPPANSERPRAARAKRPSGCAPVAGVR